MKISPSRPSDRCWPPGLRAFSLAEIMMILGILSIFAAIAVPTVLSVLPASKESIAETNLNRLNQAVLKYNQCNGEMAVAAASSSSDELEVVTALKNRAVSSPAPGSPYLSPGLSTPAVSTTDTYRATWNGKMFELTSPGASGTGLNLLLISETGS